jgi:hypothetical protein
VRRHGCTRTEARRKGWLYARPYGLECCDAESASEMGSVRDTSRRDRHGRTYFDCGRRRGVARPSTVGDITPATGAPQRPDATADGGRRPHRATTGRQIDYAQTALSNPANGRPWRRRQFRRSRQDGAVDQARRGTLGGRSGRPYPGVVLSAEHLTRGGSLINQASISRTPGRSGYGNRDGRAGLPPLASQVLGEAVWRSAA